MCRLRECGHGRAASARARSAMLRERRYRRRSARAREGSGGPQGGAAARRCRPECLLQLLPYEVEVLERGLVRHHEQVGVPAAGLMARPGPMRNGKDVVLRPFEGLLADMRAPLAAHDKADDV